MRTTARFALVITLTTALLVPLGLTSGERASAASVTWASGASGYGAATGEIGDWRGRSLDMVGSWADDNANSVNFWQLQKGGDYAAWRKSLDIAVGGISWDESWSQAAKGAYDARWTKSLTKLKSVRSHATGTTYIRFAHEMNGDWYPWQVNRSNYVSFVSAWKRYRALQKKVFPSAKLVFNVNRESVGSGMDWRRFFPGKKYVDVLSVDYYNAYPFVSTASQWNDSLDDTDQWGAPKGLATHLAFAASQNLPMAISEWSGDASFGDGKAFVTGLLSYVKSHGGWSAGQIRYEILFNSAEYGGNFAFYGKKVRMPASSNAYRTFFQKK